MRLAKIKILCFLVIGMTLILLGFTNYQRVNYVSTKSPMGLRILTNNDTRIENMGIHVSPEDATLHEKGWMYTMIFINSTSPVISLIFELPHEVANVWSDILEDELIAIAYDPATDFSSISLLCEPSFSEQSYYCFSLYFDWKLLEKISYERERVAIAFAQPISIGFPYSSNTSNTVEYAFKWFYSPTPFLNRSIGPEINRLIVQIDSNYPIDSSFTYPQPTFYYYSEEKIKAYWVFESGSPVFVPTITSVQAVFVNPIRLKEKSFTIFFSGILIGSGISAVLISVKEIIDLSREILKKKSKSEGKKIRVHGRKKQ